MILKRNDLNHQIISIKEGISLGKILKCLINVKTNEIDYLIISSATNMEELYLNYSDIVSIGDYAVMTEASDNLKDLDTLDKQNVLDVIGLKVISLQGENIGIITGVDIKNDTHEINNFTVLDANLNKEAYVSVSSVLSIGQEFIVIKSLENKLGVNPDTGMNEGRYDEKDLEEAVAREKIKFEKELKELKEEAREAFEIEKRELEKNLKIENEEFRANTYNLIEEFEEVAKIRVELEKEIEDLKIEVKLEKENSKETLKLELGRMEEKFQEEKTLIITQFESQKEEQKEKFELEIQQIEEKANSEKEVLKSEITALKEELNAQKNEIETDFKCQLETLEKDFELERERLKDSFKLEREVLADKYKKLQEAKISEEINNNIYEEKLEAKEDISRTEVKSGLRDIDVEIEIKEPEEETADEKVQEEEENWQGSDNFNDFFDKQEKILLGRTIMKDVQDKEGVTIAEKGDIITKELFDKIKSIDKDAIIELAIFSE